MIGLKTQEKEGLDLWREADSILGTSKTMVTIDI
jgi:hypothetical protein